MAEETKRCFLIAPIGPEGSDIRERSDEVRDRIVRPALEPRYEVTRGDEVSEMGEVCSQVLRRVVHDPLVVADLSGGNPNVFYELAIRHVLRKPLIQIARKGEEEYHNVRSVRSIE